MLPQLTVLRRARTLAALSLSVALLGGCTLYSGVHAARDSEVRIDDHTVAVIGFSPQLHDISPVGNGSHGFLLLVQDSGEAQILITAPVQGLHPVWAGDTVFARDRHNDISVTAKGITRTPNPSDVLQMASVGGLDGYAGFSQFDMGFGGVQSTDIDVVQELIGYRADGSYDRFIIPGDGLGATTRCEDGIYAVSSLLSGRLEEGDRSDTTLMIRQYPRPHPGDSDVVVRVPDDQKRVLSGGERGECVGNTVYTIGVEAPSAGASAPSLRESEGIEASTHPLSDTYLRSWNTHTGKVRDVRLYSDKGLPVPGYQVEMGPGSALGSEIFWYVSSGTVYATSIDTGKTREAFRTEPTPVNVATHGGLDNQSIVEFAPGRLFRFDLPRNGLDPGTLSGWDLRTGKQTFSVTVPQATEISGEPGKLQRLWGMALRPGTPETGQLPR